MYDLSNASGIFPEHVDDGRSLGGTVEDLLARVRI
jgi:hypothetical protein